MATSDDCTLRQLLVRFLVDALNKKYRLGVVPKEASHYDNVLQDAKVSTPKEVVQKERQLQSLLCNKLNPTEIQCLTVAAYKLTGVAPY